MLKAAKEYLERADILLDVPLDTAGVYEFPVGWRKIFYKKYPRFKKIRMKINRKKTPLNRLLLKRKSIRHFSGLPLSKNAVENIIFWTCGENPESAGELFVRRFYPSGGARYPLEIYLVAVNVDGMRKEIYHYDIQENQLEILDIDYCVDDVKKAMFNKFDTASVFIIITSAMSRTEIKYGNKSMMLNFIEAGHLGQNIYLKCCEEDVGCCSIAGFDRRLLSSILDLDTEEEIPLYCFAIGNIDNDDKKR
jgi:SagB-type dehydrogenase family enzyme